jgi:hypothetical protein
MATYAATASFFEGKVSTKGAHDLLSRSLRRLKSLALRKDASMGQDGHAFMASAETSRNSFSVAPLAD